MEQNRLNVCFAAHRFHPDYSGAGIRFQRYAPGLRQRGIDMSVFTGTPRQQANLPKPHQNNFKPGELLPLQYIDGLPVQRAKLPEGDVRKRHMTYVPALIRYCQQIETRPDLIQAISVSLYWLPWWLSLRRLGIPLVYSYTLLGELSSNLFKRQLQRIYWRLPFEMMDCVVTSSSVVRDALKENLGITTRIEVIPNGVDTQRFKPNTSPVKKNAICRQFGISLDAELILFVGPIIERKGVDHLLEAWKIISSERPKSYLILVGPDFRNVTPHPYPNFARKISNLLLNSNAKERVIFTGSVSNVEDFFQAADIFVFPSRREGMGNVVLEAFSCGLASVLTPFVGFPKEFGYPDKQYVLVNNDPAAVAQAVVSLLKNPDKRYQLGYQAREWIETTLTLERSLNQYAALYRELVMKRKRDVFGSTSLKPNEDQT